MFRGSQNRGVVVLSVISKKLTYLGTKIEKNGPFGCFISWQFSTWWCWSVAGVLDLALIGEFFLLQFRLTSLSPPSAPTHTSIAGTRATRPARAAMPAWKVVQTPAISASDWSTAREFIHHWLILWLARQHCGCTRHDGWRWFHWC